MGEMLLSVQNITKVFPGVRALDKVSFDLCRGEIIGLVGENGAGKSTLVKIISGVHPPTEGGLYIRSQKIDEYKPNKALELGISTIYQQLNLVPDLSVASNVLLGREPSSLKGLFVDYKKMNELTTNYLDRMGVNINPEVKVRDLSVADRQMTEIAKALSAQSEILIMDEPTSALTQAEISNLFTIMRRLREQGVGIIFISHRLEEIEEISDRIVVLRDGKKVAEVSKDETTIPAIVRHMVGETEALTKRTKKQRAVKDIKILEVKDISSRGKFSGVSFYIQKGEVVGLTGLLGSGMTSVAHVLVGFEFLDAGQIVVEGNAIDHDRLLQAGIGLVPEDRLNHGLVLPLSVRENIVFPNQSTLSQHGLRNKQKEIELTKRYINALDVKCAHYSQEVMYLSGGNQQKVVIAKWMAKKPKVLIMDQPTHGIDVKTKVEIAKLIRGLAEDGIGILLVSTEVDELLDLCDRILVMYEGKILDEMSNNEANKERITKSSMGFTE